MKFIIPYDWCEKWARIEAEADGATIPFNSQVIAQYRQEAATKRAEMLAASQPPKDAQPVDVAAIRQVIKVMKQKGYNTWGDKLARAIGDKP